MIRKDELNVWRFKFMIIFPLVSLMLLFLGCQTQTVPTAEVTSNTCPLPKELSSEDLNKVEKFGAEIKGLMSSLAGGSLDAEVQKALKRSYPDAGDVNRIYALSYAACVSCRLDPTDTKGCAQRFDTIIDGFTPTEMEPSHPAKAYRSKVVGSMKNSK